jgi:hypothetical protein
VILLPYTRLHPVTARLANRHAPGHRRVRIDPLDDGAYWRLLATAWAEPGDLVVIEQDIGLRPNVVAGFDSCRKPWCGHPYLIGAQELVCLGCTRFTAELKAAEPDLLERVGQDGSGGVPARDWRRLDVRIADELERRGYARHRHEPTVTHFHKYPTA